jgi:hypothetical protein
VTVTSRLPHMLVPAVKSRVGGDRQTSGGSMNEVPLRPDHRIAETLRVRHDHVRPLRQDGVGTTRPPLACASLVAGE